MTEKLNIEDFNKEVEVDYTSIHDECLIDINEDIKHPPIAISIGHDYNGQDVPLVTYGNFCCIVGASKSMKSFLKSGLISCYIGGKSQTYFDDIKGHNVKGKYIIDIDTEQGKYHVQAVAKRSLNMVGSNYKGYKMFALRPKTPQERLQFIDWIFNESEYAGKIGLMSIDGVADLLDNVNDLEKSNEVTQKIMSWSSDNNCAIITILHRNFDTNKPTGHLGSAILKKSETVVFVNKDEDIVTVTPRYTRNLPFNEFSFTVNEQGLPEKTGISF